MIKETKTLKVYRNGDLDVFATYIPIVKEKFLDIANRIDRQFTKPL
jgi:hypothetical protein